MDNHVLYIVVAESIAFAGNAFCAGRAHLAFAGSDAVSEGLAFAGSDDLCSMPDQQGTQLASRGSAAARKGTYGV